MANTGRQVAVDIKTGTVGEVMDEQFGAVYLRPLHGGPEWTLPADRIRPATPEEVEAAE